MKNAIYHILINLAAPILFLIACAVMKILDPTIDLDKFSERILEVALIGSVIISIFSCILIRGKYYEGHEDREDWDPLMPFGDSSIVYHLPFGLVDFTILIGAIIAIIPFLDEDYYFIPLLLLITIINVIPQWWKILKSLYYSYLYISARKWGWWLLCFINIPLYPLNLVIDFVVKDLTRGFRFIYNNDRVVKRQEGTLNGVEWEKHTRNYTAYEKQTTEHTAYTNVHDSNGNRISVTYQTTSDVPVEKQENFYVKHSYTQKGHWETVRGTCKSITTRMNLKYERRKFYPNSNKEYLS